MARRSTPFRSEWLEKEDPNGQVIRKWCRKVDLNTAMCDLCNKQLKVNQAGLSALNQHATTAKHKQMIKATKSSSSMDRFLVSASSSSKSNTSTAFQTCRAEGIWTLFSIRNNLSFHSQDKAGHCFEAMFPNDQSSSEYSCGRTKMSYLSSHGFYPYFFDGLCNELKKTFFTFHIDEASDNVKRLGVNVRYFIPNTWHLQCQLLSLEEVESSNAITMTQSVLKILHENKIPGQNLIASMTDNCATMIGNKSGVVTQLKNEMSHLIDLDGCSLHLLHNAARLAVGTFDDLEEFVSDIYSYFRKRPSLFKTFESFQESEEIKHHRFFRFVETRWLQMKPVVDRVLEQYAALSKFFQTEQKKTERLHRLVSHLNSKLTFAELSFVSYGLTEMEKMEKVFQKEGPQIHHLYDAICQLLKVLLRKFVKSKYINEDSPWKTEFMTRNQVKDSKLLIGEATRKHIQELSETERQLFFGLVRQFYETLARKLIESLPYENKNLKRLRFLQSSMRNSPVLENYVVNMARHMPTVVQEHEIDDLRDEIRHYVSLELTQTPEDVVQYWQEITEKYEFSILKRVARACLCLPHANADIERSFSQISLVMTKTRNSLSGQSLSRMLFIKSYLMSRNIEPWEVEFNSELIERLQSAHANMKRMIQLEKDSQESKKRQNEIDCLRATLEVERQFQKIPRLEEEEKELLKEKENLDTKRKNAEFLLKRAHDLLKEHGEATDANDKKLQKLNEKKKIADDKVLNAVIMTSHESLKNFGRIPKK